MAGKYPEVQGGGSLMLAWQIKNKPVLVVGGGEVAAGRILNLLNADADVIVVSPKDGLNEEVAYRIEQKQVTYIDRKFEPSDLDNINMVLTAIDDPEESTRIWKLCKELKLPANIADVPPECDFYFGSGYRDGPVQIMISTNGYGPKLASMIRKYIESMMPPNIGNATEKMGMLRRKLREIAPNPSEGPKRMQWISKFCEQWSLADLVERAATMNEDDMQWILSFYTSGDIPSLDGKDVESTDVIFDGSFGWSI